MYARGDGFHAYSGRTYEKVRRLREGKRLEEQDRKEAIKVNRNLIQNFKHTPLGKPHDVQYIYRGVDLRHAKPYAKGLLFIESKSYMSFSKFQSVAAGFPKNGNRDQGILALNFNIIPRRTPVIYNGMWGMKSKNPREGEVLLPPGIIIFSSTPNKSRNYGKKYYDVKRFIPSKLSPFK